MAFPSVRAAVFHISMPPLLFLFLWNGQQRIYILFDSFVFLCFGSCGFIFSKEPLGLSQQAEISQAGTRLLCLLSFLFSYLSNTKTFTLATKTQRKKRYKLYPFIASVSSYSVVPGAWSLPLFSGAQHGLYGGNDDPDLPIGQFICQDVKLPARRGFPICRIPKEKLIHGDVIAGRKIHLVPHFVAGLFLPRPCCFYCFPIRAKVNFLYWSLCYIHSPNYILQFIFLSGYVFIVPVIS